MLLSHRYGSRPLPTRILTKEYLIFTEELKNNADQLDISFDAKEIMETDKIALKVENLFEYCYELDENEIPSRYKLKDLEHIFTTYNPKVKLMIVLINCK